MTEPTIYERARLAIDRLEGGDPKWVESAWSVYYRWDKGLYPELRASLRDALSKVQMCHTGNIVDPAKVECRTVLEKVVELGDAR